MNKKDKGVTDNAPYNNMAEYKMVDYKLDDEDEKDIINGQGS